MKHVLDGLKIATRGCVWGVLLLGVTVGRAAPEKTPVEATSTGSVTSPSPDIVQSAESLDPNAADLLRDPFWPVGYSPVTRTVQPTMPTGPTVSSASVAEDELKKALSMFRVGGIIKRGMKCYATVNGTMVEAGDVIPIMVDGNVVIFTVRSIDMRRVRIEPMRK